MNRTGRLADKVKKTLSRHGMTRPGDVVVVAVSGGPDSVCLLHVLHRLSEELRLGVIAAHFDHGWRPGEDEEETELVRGLALSLGVPFETAKMGVVEARPPSREEAARDARYDFLEGVRARHLASKIAVGHHLHDQSETLLMRLLRGSGVSGLGAIPPVREGRIIRPLIEATKQEIERYLRETGTRYAIDSSNLNPELLRNRVRQELIPLLQKYQPRLIERLGETAALLREESAFLDSLAAEWVGKEGSCLAEGARVPLGTFLELPSALRKRVIRAILGMVKGNTRRIGANHIHAVEELACSPRPQAMLHLPDGLRVRRSYESLSFLSRAPETVRFSYSLAEPGTLFIPEIGKTLSVAYRKDGGSMRASPWHASLDAEKVRFPLTVRSPRPGDRFIPLGMKGHKKLKDLFVDLKVPDETRRTTPVLTQGEKILWVAGFRLDERVKITPSTRVVLECEIRQAAGKSGVG